MNFIPRSQHLNHINIAGVLNGQDWKISYRTVDIFISLSTYLLPTVGAFHFKRRCSLIKHTLYSIDPLIHDQILRLKIIVPKHIKYAEGWLPKTL